MLVDGSYARCGKWGFIFQAYEDVLTVYNANLDDAIDENDVEYVRGIIDGTEDETQFADANYDGKIDEDDIVQIEAQRRKKVNSSFSTWLIVP